MGSGQQRFRVVTDGDPAGGSPPAADGDLNPELADVARLLRRLVRQAVSIARAEEGSVRHLLAGHLGPQVATFPVANGTWPRYDQVNVQAGLDAWLAEPGREYQIAGLTGLHHQLASGLADLAAPGPAQRHSGIGSVTTVALPSGPDGATRPCVQCALYLVTDPGGRLAVLVRPAEEQPGVVIEVASPSHDRGQQAVAEIRRLAVEHNVFRGHVVGFGGEVFGQRHGALLSFLRRPEVGRDQVILPPEVLDGVERQVIGVARHAGALLAGGQHLKRGVLLHGAPGTGKTHTVRYLLSQLTGTTVVVLSGGALRLISEACSVARMLQPSVIVVEDVDLIAEERGPRMGQHPLLFQLLNEMDGLAADADVAFLLTTNRADLLEPALAERPGRVDHAALLPLPDAAARGRLLRLYQGNLDLYGSDLDQVIARTEGVTASFLKEFLRRAALLAAAGADPGEAGPGGAGPGGAGARLRVTDEHLTAALDELLDSRNQLTQVLLGVGPRRPGQRGDAAMGADAVIPARRSPPPDWPLRR